MLEQVSLFDTHAVSVCNVSASEKEAVGLMRNIHFLVKNGLSLNKASSLLSHVDDMLPFFMMMEHTRKMNVISKYNISYLVCHKLTAVATVIGNLCIL